jgi:hypothetical protein
MIKPRRRPKFGAGEMIILMIIGILILIVVTGNLRFIWEKLYSAYSAFIAVIMLVEYLLLKGSDRSAIYRRELEAARQKRRDDLLALRDMETQLVELRARLTTALERADDAQTLRETIETSRQINENVLGRLRERI